jgi:hypothetical protein
MEFRLRTLLGEHYLILDDDLLFWESPKLKKISEFLLSIGHKDALPECLGFEKKLMALSRWDLYKVFGRVDMSMCLLPALHGCSSVFIAAVIQNVSVKLGIYIAQEWENCKPRNKNHCISAQQNIIRVVNELIEMHEIADTSHLSQESVNHVVNSSYSANE